MRLNKQPPLIAGASSYQAVGRIHLRYLASPLFLLLLACTPIPIATTECAWVKPIQTKDAVVRGSKAFLASRDSLLDQDRDILTQSTAGQIVALKKAVKEFCK